MDCFASLAMTKTTTNNTRKHPMNDIVLQKLEAGLLTITMNRPDRRNALNPEMTSAGAGRRRHGGRPEDHEVRAVLPKGAGGPFWCRRRCQVDGRGAGAVAVRGQDDQSAARHGSLPRPAPDARSRWWRRSTMPPPGPGFFDRAGLRSACRLGVRQDHHGLCQGRSFRRLWRHVFPDPSARQRQGARTSICCRRC